MTTLSTCLTPAQLVTLWGQLVECYYDQNSYGGTTAEIYAWTLVPYSPTAAKSQGPIGCESRREQAEYAAKALSEVLRYFCEMYGCGALIDGEVFMGECGPFDHRVHVFIKTPVEKPDYRG